MNLNEQLLRIKVMMGLNESTENKIIYNLDMIEAKKPAKKRLFEPRVDDSDVKAETPKNDGDFSQSVVKDVVYRAGDIKLNPMNGGIWFADTKDAVEKFSLSVRGEKRDGKGYRINLKNPYYFDKFWNGYIKATNSANRDSRKQLMEKLISQGHDGIIINDDWWSDTGDEYAVYGKQFIVFNESNIKPA